MVFWGGLWYDKEGQHSYTNGTISGLYYQTHSMRKAIIIVYCGQYGMNYFDFIQRDVRVKSQY